MKHLKTRNQLNEASENLNSELSKETSSSISDVMNSVLNDLYNELSELNNTIKNVDSDNHEYYLGRIKGVESSIQIIEKHNT
jgi:predicted negative regulator of RcsB-dependent stress response